MDLLAGEQGRTQIDLSEQLDRRLGIQVGRMKKSRHGWKPIPLTDTGRGDCSPFTVLHHGQPLGILTSPGRRKVQMQSVQGQSAGNRLSTIVWLAGVDAAE